MSTPTVPTRISRLVFVGRLTLAVVLMAAGMAVLMAVSSSILADWLASYGDRRGLVSLVLMGLAMAIPVLVWVRVGAYPRGRLFELGAALLIPTILAVAAAGFGFVRVGTASLWQHVLMLAGLVGAMSLRYPDYASAQPAPVPAGSGAHRGWARWWPTATGIALAVVSLVTDDPSDARGVLMVLLIATTGYVVIASTGRAAWSWRVLGVLVAAYLVGKFAWDAGELLLGLASLAAVLAGAFMRRWNGPPCEMRWQVAAAALFLGVAWVSQLTSPDLGKIVLSLFLVVHGAWDIHHWRRDVVVSRSLSAWCAALDITLGVGTLLLHVMR